jgi:hypothetical protein
VFDLGFILAVGALGWGLSLATYRAVAIGSRWPMGAWHAFRPHLPVLIGALSAAVAMLVAIERMGGGDASGGSTIVVFGVGWAVFWTGFLRVAAQNALLLAPAAAAFLLLLRSVG